MESDQFDFEPGLTSSIWALSMVGDWVATQFKARAADVDIEQSIHSVQALEAIHRARGLLVKIGEQE